jgi:hypothetical protein
MTIAPAERRLEMRRFAFDAPEFRADLPAICLNFSAAKKA